MKPIDKIYAALRTGEDNAVSLADMCIISGLDNRSTRLCIESIRRSGKVICSSEKGYFLPANTLELSRYIHKERCRANSISRTLSPAEKLLSRWGVMGEENNDVL